MKNAPANRAKLFNVVIVAIIFGVAESRPTGLI